MILFNILVFIIYFKNQFQLAEYSDAISETSSQIEFSHIFGKDKPIRVTDLKDASVHNAPERQSMVSKKTAAISLKTYKSRKFNIKRIQ